MACLLRNIQGQPRNKHVLKVHINAMPRGCGLCGVVDTHWLHWTMPLIFLIPQVRKFIKCICYIHVLSLLTVNGLRFEMRDFFCALTQI